jgi:hypothetical protein
MILSALISLPVLGALLLALMPSKTDAQQRIMKLFALLVTMINFAVSLKMLCCFDASASGFQFVEKRYWWPAFDLAYHVGVDGISYWLVMLSTFLMPICDCLPDVGNADDWRVRVAGSFLFYVFFEAGLIPMYLIIGIWGGKNRIYASFKFFLYTLLGSVLMLLALLAMYFRGRHTDIPTADGLPVRPQGADLAVAGLLRLVRGQDADVAGSYLVARCARRGADRGLRHSGGCAAEDGRLRLPALLAADVPGWSREFAMMAGVRCRPSRSSIPRWWRWRRGHEEADRLFVGRPHGLRDHGYLHRQPPGHRGRDVPDAVATASCRPRCSCASACL